MAFFSCLTIILLKLDPDNRNFKKKNIFKTLYNVFYLVAIFLLFSLFVSYFKIHCLQRNNHQYQHRVCHNGCSYLCAIATTENLKNLFGDDVNDAKDGLFTIIKNILFVIPCYVVDFIEFVKNNVSGMPKTSYIISIVIALTIVCLLYIPIPQRFHQKLIRRHICSKIKIPRNSGFIYDSKSN